MDEKRGVRILRYLGTWGVMALLLAGCDSAAWTQQSSTKPQLVKKARLGSPLVEVSPVIWKGRLMLMETVQPHFLENAKGGKYYVEIRDVEKNQIVSTCMEGYQLASAFVWSDTFYVFAAQVGPHSSNHVYLSKSTDLVHWTEPRLVVEQTANENIFNSSVCWDGRRFVMAYESNDKAYPPFTIKFAQSPDLDHWSKIPQAIYGKDRYTACPALRYVGGYYYMLYLEHLKPRWWFETWLTRSQDLLTWQDSPRNPVIAPSGKVRGGYGFPLQSVESFRSPAMVPQMEFFATQEINASDPDLVEYQGRTRVYFTGGNQHVFGDLQYAEFDGPMQAFFESYYP